MVSDVACTLCRSPNVEAWRSDSDAREYRRCATCDLHFLNPAHRLKSEDERARYDLHRADHLDDGYLRFVSPLVRTLEAKVRPGARGLDFGAGRVPVLAKHLETRGFRVALYDGFYWPEVRVLSERYDFVVSCEVIEHFFEPAREFAKLRELLAPGAPLVVMTDPRRDDVDFDRWYYRRDPTHVSFYSHRTFSWIAEAFGFRNVEVANRVVCFSTPEAP